MQPAQHLTEDFPAIARFLLGNSEDKEDGAQNEELSEYAKEQLTDKMTDQVMSAVEEIMTRAEAGGYNPDDEIAELISKTVIDALEARDNILSEEAEVQNSTTEDDQRANKKQKTDES